MSQFQSTRRQPTPNEDSILAPACKVKLIKTTRLPNGLPIDFPCFRFGGRYLENFGFSIGTPVTMVLEQNKITLTVAADKPTEKLPY
jgi:hypothetical protein